MHSVEKTYLQKSLCKKSFGVVAFVVLIASVLVAVSAFTFLAQSAYASENAQTVYRMYNDVTSEHLFTTDENEYNSLTTEGWQQEGVSWYSPNSSAKGVYRLYNAGLGFQSKMSHHYTTDYNEAKELVDNQGWAWDNDAQPIFYSAEATDGTLISKDSVKATAVYRLYNDGLSAHLFTLDDNEKSDNVESNGWVDEGDGFYAYKYKCVIDGHSYSDWEVEQAATCDGAGLKSRTCSVCGNHEGEEIPKLSHVYTWVAEKEATCTEDGLNVEQCSLCGTKTGKTEAVGALGHNFVNDVCTRCGIKDAVGKTVTLGTYEQDNNTANGKESIEWQVLDAKLVDGETVGLLVSKYGLDAQQYDPSGNDVTWETSSILSWLNDNFYSTAFSATDKASIVKTDVTNSDNSDYETEGGNDTQDNVFLLSIDEANEYFDNIDARACYATEYALAQGARKYANGDCAWWLRSPGNAKYAAAAVNPNGDVDTFGGDVNYESNAVRPALWAVL